MRRKGRGRVRYRRDGSVVGKAVTHAFVVEKEAGRLVCSMCDEVISRDSTSVSLQFGSGTLVSCERCMPGLVEAMEEVSGEPIPVELRRALFGGGHNV